MEAAPVFCFVANYLDDVLIVAGLVMIAVGCWLVSPTVSLLVTGGILLFMGLMAAWRRGN